MTTTLYDLGAAAKSLASLLDYECQDGEIPPDIDAALRRLDLSTAERVEECVRLIRDLEGREKARRDEAARLERSARRAKDGAARVRQELLAYLQGAGEDSIDAGPFRVRRQLGNGRIVVECRTDELPIQFIRIKHEPNLDALKKASAAGESLPEGVSVMREETLRIS